MNSEAANKLCRIGILISGRGSNMVALVDAVKDGAVANAEVAIVISDKPDAAGLAKAAERGVETLVVERKKRTRAEHDGEIANALKERGVNLVCLAGYMRLLSPDFIAAYREQILNIHPSLLPAFTGLNAQRQALDYGVKFSGCTVHFVDEELDHGAIVAQRVVPVTEDDTEETLSAKILVEEHKLYAEALTLIASGNYSIEGRSVKAQSDI